MSASPERPRPKMTVVVPFAVHPPVGGGQLRVFSLYRHIARAFDVELVTLAESDSEYFEGEIAPGLREIRVPKSGRHQQEESRLAAEAGDVPIGDIAIPLFVEHTPRYGKCVARSIETASVVVACHPYCLPAVGDALGGRPLVYEAQDVEYLLKKEVLSGRGATGEKLVELVRELEGAACRASSIILCCSEGDRDELSRLYSIEPSRFVMAPNGVDTAAIRFISPAARKRLKAERGLTGQPIALFVGSWHPPNLEAAEALFETARALPDVRFLLVGSQCRPLADRLRPSNVGLMGVVDAETLDRTLALADVALNPMLSGTGSNIKLATYLAAGVPVLTTAVGARGYDVVDGEHAVICGVENFPEAITRLLDDAAPVEAMTRRGRRLVERQHDWRTIALEVTDALLSLLAPWRRDALEDLIDRVATEVEALGMPDDYPAVRLAAEAVVDLGRPRPSEAARPLEADPKRIELQALADSVPFWFHSIDLGHGVTTRGVKSPAILAAEVRNLRLPDLKGKTVLDIGAWDGFFTFEAERRGAARIVSLDHFMWGIDPAVTRYYQDCREQGIPPVPGTIAPVPAEMLPGKRGYDIAARALGSKAEAIVADFMTMDLAPLGQFDVVFYLGVIYHMQDLLVALRRLASVTRELAVLESEAIEFPGHPEFVMCEFYEGSELNADASNWWSPTRTALEAMCRTAGFSRAETIVGPPEPAVAGDAAGPLIHYRIFVHAWK